MIIYRNRQGPAGPQGDPGSDAAVTNANVVAAIASDPGTARGALDVLSTDEARRSLLGVIESADHAWLCGESSGDFYDVRGGMNLTDTNTVAGAAASASWNLARDFVMTNSERGAGTAIALDGGAFWFAVGLNFTSTGATSSGGIIGQTDGTGITWMLRRVSSTSLEFYITRSGGSGTHSVIVTGMSAGVDYNITGRFDGTNLWLTVNGVEYYADASYGMWATNKPFSLGYAQFSGTAAFNYHNGDIAYALVGTGHLAQSHTAALAKADAADWQAMRRRYTGLEGWGDSLTSAAYATTSWVERAATDARGLPWAMHGIGGQNSDGILARLVAMPDDLLARGWVALWLGNNNPTETAQVIADVTAARTAALAAGARTVILLGLPNRSRVDATAATVDALQADLDTINTALAALATANADTEYIDVHDLFVNPANYTPTDADDIADQTLGVVPRSARDTPASASSTHLGDVGAQHLADAVVALIDA